MQQGIPPLADDSNLGLATRATINLPRCPKCGRPDESVEGFGICHGCERLLQRGATAIAPGDLHAGQSTNGTAPATDPDEDLVIDMVAAMKLADVPISFAIEPIAAHGFLTVLAGRHSSYKSWLMLMASHAAHRGGEVAGMRCEQTRALYVDAENGPRLMGRNFKKAGIPAAGLVVANGTKLHLPQDLDLLRALVMGTGAGLVVLDSLRRLAPGIRENESDDVAALIAELATLARDFDAAVVLIHHRSTKAGSATLRGSSSIEDQADLVFALERVPGDHDRQRRRLKAVKYRIDAEPPPIWLKLVEGVPLAISAAEPCEGGGDPDGEDGADEQLADRIDALADQVRRDGGWQPKRLAAAVGRSQDDGTFKRALNLLLGRGAWTGNGNGRGRRLRPSEESGQPGQPLGNGPVSPIQGDEEASE